MGVCPISLTKFVGTFSLGLLTGTAYNLSTHTIPSLALLPSASHASTTLTSLQTSTTRTTLTLSSITSLSFITAYTLARPRGKHPYLLWTALVSFAAGQGTELYYNGLTRFPGWKSASSSSTQHSAIGIEGSASGDDFVNVSGNASPEGSSHANANGSANVNGEKVEAEMSRERRVQGVRALTAGLAFLMAIVGIWGDGA